MFMRRMLYPALTNYQMNDDCMSVYDKGVILGMISHHSLTFSLDFSRFKHSSSFIGVNTFLQDYTNIECSFRALYRINVYINILPGILFASSSGASLI